MTNSEYSSTTPSEPTPLSPSKEILSPVGSKIAELNESRTELLSRIQGLKQDLQNWRSKLDTQVKVYANAGFGRENFLNRLELTVLSKARQELSDLKKSLTVEVEQLQSDFQELRTTLQQQQEDVAARLKDLGLQDVARDSKMQDPEVEENFEKTHASPEEDDGRETKT